MWLEWLSHAKALPPETSERLRDAVARNAELAEDIFATATALRSAIHRVGAAIGRGSVPPEAPLATLSAIYARCVGRASLAPEKAACRWRWNVGEAPTEAALGPIALAAVGLFTGGDFHRIKECGGHACGWLFYDTSKNNRRRWCEMEVCGNRAKQKRLAARRRRH